jgi:acyl dehydratase
VQDKGASRGAVVTLEQSVVGRQTDELLATLTTTRLGRKERGCGNGGYQPTPQRHVPARERDAAILAPTSTDLARAYSRTGDENPLHTDLAVANAAGFPGPILHGLRGFGTAGRDACDALTTFGRQALIALEAHFSAPAYPGDLRGVDLWRDHDGTSFLVRVPDRGIVAMTAGYARLA